MGIRETTATTQEEWMRRVNDRLERIERDTISRVLPSGWIFKDTAAGLQVEHLSTGTITTLSPP